MYCEKCKYLFDGDHCPNCRKSHVRPVQPEDPCFLVEKGAPWNGMLAHGRRAGNIRRPQPGEQLVLCEVERNSSSPVCLGLFKRCV